MSEYQYYEFQSVDRPLTQAALEEVSQLSSRVQLSSTKAVFSYSYSDFPGNPQQILAKHFDAMFYIANWGSLQLMFRFPSSLIDVPLCQKYCLEDCLTISRNEDKVILSIEFNDEEGFDWIEGEGNLDALIGLRQEILQGDLRVLYLAWLKAIDWYRDRDPNLSEPPVPNRLGQLSRSLQAFTEIFSIDLHLVTIAALKSPPQRKISDNTIRTAIQKLERSECDDFLLRLAKGESALAAKLNKRLSELIANREPTFQQPRTIKQLLTASKKEQQQAELRQQKEAEAIRIKELETFAKKEEIAWKDVFDLIQKGKSKSYDEAVQLLLKLRELAQYQEKEPAFIERINQIHEQYSRRSGLRRRLQNAGLNQQ